jgi:hypothetical protein
VGGGDIVRNVDVTADGNVVTANSLVMSRLRPLDV